MIDTDYLKTMARYNRWQNASLYAAADQLDAAVRNQDRGAFFGSIRGTLCHILWADQIWMHRFSGSPKPPKSNPDSHLMIEDWEVMKEARLATDQLILDWAQTLDADWLKGNLTWYSGAVERDMMESRALLVAHMFNHQTHHRGQVHAMLTAAGVKPDDTDLMLVDVEPRHG
ncbi:MAG: DinB family protein [Alphaproteobacteria bacterium]|nr:DinB family protein [Alphaproteobacteria bacterium]